MKKAMVLALCLILAGLMLVNGTFALPNLSDIFTTFTNWLSAPEEDESIFNVELCYPDRQNGTAPELLPGQEVQYRVAVQNLSTTATENPNKAYFRVAVAMQKEAMHCMTLGFTQSADYELKGWTNIQISGKDYYLMVATYLKPLAVNTTSPAVLETIKLNSDTTSEQTEKIDPQNFLQVQVLAIDADDFKDSNDVPLLAEEALNQAMPIISTFNPFK